MAGTTRCGEAGKQALIKVGRGIKREGVGGESHPRVGIHLCMGIYTLIYLEINEYRRHR